jgi:hypothetical protein
MLPTEDLFVHVYVLVDDAVRAAHALMRVCLAAA